MLEKFVEYFNKNYLVRRDTAGYFINSSFSLICKEISISSDKIIFITLDLFDYPINKNNIRQYADWVEEMYIHFVNPTEKEVRCYFLNFPTNIKNIAVLRPAGEIKNEFVNLLDIRKNYYLSTFDYVYLIERVDKDLKCFSIIDVIF